MIKRLIDRCPLRQLFLWREKNLRRGRTLHMKIIKRNGAEVAFDIQKIERAITKANNSVTEAQGQHHRRQDPLPHRVQQ